MGLIDQIKRLRKGKEIKPPKKKAPNLSKKFDGYDFNPSKNTPDTKVKKFTPFFDD